jgi:hypothetical protein
MNAEKDFEKIQHPLGVKGMYLNIIKTKRGKNAPISSEARNDTGCPLSPTVIQYSFGILCQSNEEETKVIQIGKEVKLSLFAVDMILYLPKIP